MYRFIKSTALSAAILSAFSMVPSANAFAQSAVTATATITKAQAVKIAEAAEPGAKFQAVVFDRFDQPPHWSVDLFNAVHDYEVWVSPAGKVLRIIVQPH